MAGIISVSISVRLLFTDICSNIFHWLMFVVVWIQEFHILAFCTETHYFFVLFNDFQYFSHYSFTDFEIDFSIFVYWSWTCIYLVHSVSVFAVVKVFELFWFWTFSEFVAEDFKNSSTTNSENVQTWRLLKTIIEDYWKPFGCCCSWIQIRWTNVQIYKK